MTETNQKILDMISKNASANEICAATGLSNKQLFYRLNMLKTKGYNFSKKYYYDGEITYKLQRGFESEKEISLLTSPKDNEFKAVFISDLHLANKKDRVDLLDQVYNFCIKEGIHIIINAGDLIDGFLGLPQLKKFNSSEEQIDYALKVYPFDKNILNFTVLGNHDYNILEKSGQNLETILSAKRHDIISLGYGVGVLKIKNDKIIVKHRQTTKNNSKPQYDSGLILFGHTHKAKNVINGNIVNMFLSSLCDLGSSSNYEDFTLPGFVKATINFQNGIFNLGVFEQYIFTDKMYKINELHCELCKGKNTKQKIIEYEEERIPCKVKEKIKSIGTNQPKLSQIDKFNMKYNK